MLIHIPPKNYYLWKRNTEHNYYFWNPDTEQSGELFAFVTLAQLELNDAKKRVRSKKSSPPPPATFTAGTTVADKPGPPWDELYEFKKRVIVKLLGKNFARREIRSLLIFLDWLVQLPAPIEERLDEALDAFVFAQTKEEVLKLLR